MVILIVFFKVVRHVKCLTKVLAVYLFYFILINMIKLKSIKSFLKILACFIANKNFDNETNKKIYGNVTTFLKRTNSVSSCSLRDRLIDLIKNAPKIFLFLMYSGALVTTFHSN